MPVEYRHYPVRLRGSRQCEEIVPDLWAVLANLQVKNILEKINSEMENELVPNHLRSASLVMQHWSLSQIYTVIVAGLEMLYLAFRCRFARIGLWMVP